MIHPFIIGGAPRSGTTLVMQVLNMHPQIAVSYEQDLLGVVGRAFRKSWKGRTADRWLTPREKFSHEDLVKAIYSPEKSMSGLLEGLYRPIFPDKHWERDVWVGDKWNLVDPIEDIPTIEASNFRVLWITRNPVDTVASAVERRRHEVSFPPDEDVALSLWYRSFSVVIRSQFRVKAIHVQYEDFALRTRKCLDRILSWMGLTGAATLSRKAEGVVDRNVFHRTGIKEKLFKNLLASPIVEEYKMYLRRTGQAPESLRSLEE